MQQAKLFKNSKPSKTARCADSNALKATEAKKLKQIKQNVANSPPLGPASSREEEDQASSTNDVTTTAEDCIDISLLPRFTMSYFELQSRYMKLLSVRFFSNTDFLGLVNLSTPPIRIKHPCVYSSPQYDHSIFPPPTNDSIVLLNEVDSQWKNDTRRLTSNLVKTAKQPYFKDRMSNSLPVVSDSIPFKKAELPGSHEEKMQLLYKHMQVDENRTMYLDSSSSLPLDASTFAQLVTEVFLPENSEFCTVAKRPISTFCPIIVDTSASSLDKVVDM